MRVLVTASARFAQTPNGDVWTDHSSLGYRFWSRYLDVFDDVRLLVRAWPVNAPPAGWNRATGPGISARALPNFVGPVGYARAYPAVKRIIAEALRTTDAIQLRVPCPVGDTVWRALPAGRPYGAEVVADPFDDFAPGSVRHLLRPVFRWWFTRNLRTLCAEACAIAYVTERALQTRYPPGRNAYTTHYSSVDLPASAFAAHARTPVLDAGPVTLITVGTLAQLYKATDILLVAVASCVRTGLDLRLVVVGDGKHRGELETQARALGLGARVEFTGQLSDPGTVRTRLDGADLFVLPSRQEGLPRAMIEAMARALPCIGSTVGGIPELLSREDMVPVDDADALAARIRAVVTDAARMARMSARNLLKARDYREDCLRARRVKLYEQARDRAAEWLHT